MTAYAVPGGPSGFGGLGPWRYRTEIVAPPASGQLRFNNASPAAATLLWIHDVNDDAVDMSNFLNLLTVGSLIYIQDQSNALNYIVVEITSTTDQGVYVEYGITTAVVSGVVPSQNSKVSVVVGQSGAGQTTLQGAYNNSLGAVPMILLDAVPTPISIRASVAGDVFQVQDVGNVNTIFEITANPDTIVAQAAVTIRDPFLHAASPNSIVLNDTFSSGGAFIGASILSNGTLTSTVSTTWIWSLVQDNKIYQMGVNPAFAAWALFNVLCTIQNAGNFNLVQAIVVNNGAKHQRVTSGTSTTQGGVGLNNAAQTRANVSGAVMTNTVGNTAVTQQLTFSTVTGSTINMGTSRGLWVKNTAVALFATQNGVENMTAAIGLDVDALPFGGNIVKAAVRSAITPASNSYFLLNNGNANSDHGAGHMYFDDNFGIAYGGAGVSNFDVWQSWNGAGGYFRTFFVGNADALRWSNPGNDRFLFDNDGGSTTGEYNFNCAKFSLGAQIGANGNQVGGFVAGARSTAIGGEWSDFLLTQAANITVDHAMGGLFAWTINAPSITLGTGTVTTAGALNVGGNVNQGSVNRFGVRIISNPSGGSGVNAALWVTAGLSRFDGRVDINQPIALGGGGNATLGAVGGSGPTNTAQAQWVEIDINGVAHWIPAWT